MKTYIDAKLQIVCTDNCDIVTTSVGIGGAIKNENVEAGTSGRRSIWD